MVRSSSGLSVTPVELVPGRPGCHAVVHCRVSRDCPLPDGVTAPELLLAEGSPDSSAVTPIGADHRVQLHYGVQGGFHVYLQFLLKYFESNRLTPFGVYCLAAGLVCTIAFAAGL